MNEVDADHEPAVALLRQDLGVHGREALIGRVLADPEQLARLKLALAFEAPAGELAQALLRRTGRSAWWQRILAPAAVAGVAAAVVVGVLRPPSPTPTRASDAITRLAFEAPMLASHDAIRRADFEVGSEISRLRFE